MKKFLLIFTLILLAAVGIYLWYMSTTNTAQIKEKFMTDKKVLVAYYSYSGNTKAVAEKIADLTDADIYEIIPKNAYPTGYNEVVEQAKKEKKENFMPELTENTKDLSKYDVIFLGTPVWWYTAAPPMKTFVSKNNFEGKTIVPFCTHGGGGASATYDDIKKLAPKAKVLVGYTSYEKTATDKEIAEWIKAINL